MISSPWRLRRQRWLQHQSHLDPQQPRCRRFFQLFSFGSKHSAQFLAVWKRIVFLLYGVANTGSVELGDLQLAAYFAEKKPTGQPLFRNGSLTIRAPYNELHMKPNVAEYSEQQYETGDTAPSKKSQSLVEAVTIRLYCTNALEGPPKCCIIETCKDELLWYTTRGYRFG
nr:hypothetical protein CFP56_51140 [Quercus suber]